MPPTQRPDFLRAPCGNRSPYRHRARGGDCPKAEKEQKGPLAFSLLLRVVWSLSAIGWFLLGYYLSASLFSSRDRREKGDDQREYGDTSTRRGGESLITN